MKARKLKWLIGSMVLAIILSSCNLGATPVPTEDIGAIQTQAFGQVMTQVAAAVTPTFIPTVTLLPTSTLAAPPTFAAIGGGSGTVTPFAFNTPLPGLTPAAASAVPTVSQGMITTKNGCNDGIYTGESAPYDGAVLEPSRPYEKNFTYLNTGSCTWDEGYTFVFMPDFSTPGFKGYNIVIKKTEDFIEPLESITFRLKLTSSHIPGEHIGAWKLRDDGGNYFGSMVFIKYVIGTKAEREAAAEAESLTATAEAK